MLPKTKYARSDDVRAGIHTGECEMMGDNVGGIAVNIGARIMSSARPGSVLVSGR
jgi:class 3 adenylate cyclase